MLYVVWHNLLYLIFYTGIISYLVFLRPGTVWYWVLGSAEPGIEPKTQYHTVPGLKKTR